MVNIYYDGEQVMMDAATIWNTILTLFLPIAFLVIRSMNAKIEKLSDLISRTREQYATREELQKLMDLLHRLEDKLDRALDK